MRGKLALRCCVGLCLLAAAISVFASQRAEPNAFLATRADTLSQLIQQVRSDREVSDRFQRHFGKTQDQLLAYFGSLHLAKLNQEGIYMVYAVDDQGVIKGRPQRLKAGTRVFSDVRGVPILLASCGNAMVAGTNAQIVTLTPMITRPFDLMRDFAVTPPESTAVTADLIALAPGSPAAIEPAFPSSSSTSTSRRNQMSVPIFLAAISGAGGLLLSGGGRPPGPVPEPATILVMAGALAAFKLRRKSR